MRRIVRWIQDYSILNKVRPGTPAVEMIGHTFKKGAETRVQLRTDSAGRIEQILTEDNQDVTKAIEGIHFEFADQSRDAAKPVWPNVFRTRASRWIRWGGLAVGQANWPALG
jgi:hypothetical protein